MNIAAAQNIAQYCTGSYAEVVIPSRCSKKCHIHRLIPVLADITKMVENNNKKKAAELSPSSSAAAGISSLFSTTEQREPHAIQENVTEYRLQWKGLTTEEVRRNLVPVKFHYKQQFLFLKEQRVRRSITSEEFAERLEVGIHFRYAAPSREKLLKWVPAGSQLRPVDVEQEELQLFSRVISEFTLSQQQQQQQSASKDFSNAASVSSAWRTAPCAATRNVPKNGLEIHKMPTDTKKKLTEVVVVDCGDDEDAKNVGSECQTCLGSLSTVLVSVDSVPTVSGYLLAFDDPAALSGSPGSVHKKGDGGNDSFAASLLEKKVNEDDSPARLIGVDELSHCEDSLEDSIFGDVAQQLNFDDDDRDK